MPNRYGNPSFWDKTQAWTAQGKSREEIQDLLFRERRAQALAAKLQDKVRADMLQQPDWGIVEQMVAAQEQPSIDKAAARVKARKQAQAVAAEASPLLDDDSTFDDY